MLWLYFVTGIPAFLLLILLIPIGVNVNINEDLRVTLKIGFIPLTLYPQKPKKEKTEKKKSEPKKKNEKKPEKKKTNIIKEKGLPWLIDVIKKAANLASGALKSFFGHIVIKKFMLSIIVVGKDAADTAVKYGYCCSAVYPAAGVVMGAVKCRKYGIDISPDFAEDAKTEVHMELKASILLLWLAGLVLKYGIKGLKLLIEIKQ